MKESDVQLEALRALIAGIIDTPYGRVEIALSGKQHTTIELAAADAGLTVEGWMEAKMENALKHAIAAAKADQN